MADIFHIIYQPNLNKTLRDTGVKEKDSELTPEQFAGLQLALYAIFGRDADEHIQIFGVAEPIDLESYIVPQEESGYSRFSIQPGDRRYTALIAGPQNVLLTQFDKPHHQHHHQCHHESIQEYPYIVDNEGMITPWDQGLNEVKNYDIEYDEHLGLSKKEKEEFKEAKKKHQWDFLQGAANAYKWFGLDYHKHIRDIYDWKTNTLLKLP
jgi:hypothetical protein